MAFSACQENNDNNPVPYCVTHANTFSVLTQYDQKVANLCTKTIGAQRTHTNDRHRPPMNLATSWCAEWIFLFLPFHRRLCFRIGMRNITYIITEFPKGLPVCAFIVPRTASHSHFTNKNIWRKKNKQIFRLLNSSVRTNGIRLIGDDKDLIGRNLF